MKNGRFKPVFSFFIKQISFNESPLPFPACSLLVREGEGAYKIHDEATLFSSSYSLPEPVGVSRVLFKKHSEQKKLKTENEAFAVYAAAQY